jgi:N-acetyl-gamma-glutamyl-phosphate reductase
MARIFIDGDSGTTGLEIRERLAGCVGIEMVSIAPEHRKDPQAKRMLLAEVDLAILCLPDDAAREVAALCDALGDRAPRLLDASTAHRVAPDWVYGFAEIAPDQPQKIAAARRVANPGCYATGAIALLAPLVAAGLIARDAPLTINAVSGYSGGGKKMIEAYEAGTAPAFELYALGMEHKHLPEIATHSGLTRAPLFVPSVGNFRQGMLVSIPLWLDELPGRPKAADLEAAFTRHYAGARWVKPRPAPGDRLDATTLNGSDEMELFVYATEAKRQAALVARLDNLGKGASGAAVQNLELMLGAA